MAVLSYHILFTAIHGTLFLLITFILYHTYRRNQSKVAFNLSLACLSFTVMFWISSFSYVLLPLGLLFWAKFINTGSAIFGFAGMAYLAKVVVIGRFSHISLNWVYTIPVIGAWAIALSLIFYEDPTFNQYGIVDWNTNFLGDFIFFITTTFVVLSLGFSLLPNLYVAQTRLRAILVTVGALIAGIFFNIGALAQTPEVFFLVRIVPIIGLSLIIGPLVLPAKIK